MQSVCFVLVVEAVGGKCLPCVVDIQEEEAVKSAIEQTVQKFGGIDILVNNASAIHLTGTVATPMKRYDLMHRINTRGTYLWCVAGMGTVISGVEFRGHTDICTYRSL
jgi:NADP-dependent 3-hydroxy acid dehydrogenase YdfG